MSALGQDRTLSASDWRLDQTLLLGWSAYRRLKGAGAKRKIGNEIRADIVRSGAVESCATPKRKQYLPGRCGRKGPLAQRRNLDGSLPEPPPRNASARGQGWTLVFVSVPRTEREKSFRQTVANATAKSAEERHSSRLGTSLSGNGGGSHVSDSARLGGLAAGCDTIRFGAGNLTLRNPSRANHTLPRSSGSLRQSHVLRDEQREEGALMDHRRGRRMRDKESP